MGIHERDWYQEHYDENFLGIKRRKRPNRSAPADSVNVRQARPRGRVRPTTWLDRNWWRLISWAAFVAVVFAIGTQVSRHL